jgi:hypothetical protein
MGHLSVLPQPLCYLTTAITTDTIREEITFIAIAAAIPQLNRMATGFRAGAFRR